MKQVLGNPSLCVYLISGQFLGVIEKWHRCHRWQIMTIPATTLFVTARISCTKISVYTIENFDSNTSTLNNLSLSGQYTEYTMVANEYEVAHTETMSKRHSKKYKVTTWPCSKIEQA